jgi:hypothetical protein
MRSNVGLRASRRKSVEMPFVFPHLSHSFQQDGRISDKLSSENVLRDSIGAVAPGSRGEICSAPRRVPLDARRDGSSGGRNRIIEPRSPGITYLGPWSGVLLAGALRQRSANGRRGVPRVSESVGQLESTQLRREDRFNEYVCRQSSL